MFYAFLGITGNKIPGVEDLVQFIDNASGAWIYVAAFLAISIEGLYIIGNFFPGSTMVLIVAVLSGVKGFGFFVSIILTIFIGWVLAGAINIYIASHYRSKILKRQTDNERAVHDQVWTTWFPSFRANYEVAQVVEGHEPLKVFWSSLRVRLWASLAAAIWTYALSLLIDINEVSNQEGFWSVLVVVAISITVGVWKLRQTNNSGPASKLS